MIIRINIDLNITTALKVEYCFESDSLQWQHLSYHISQLRFLFNQFLLFFLYR